jgi:hypothetical protein
LGYGKRVASLLERREPLTCRIPLSKLTITTVRYLLVKLCDNQICAVKLLSAADTTPALLRQTVAGKGAARWNGRRGDSSTRWLTVAASPLNICALGDSLPSVRAGLAFSAAFA